MVETTAERPSVMISLRVLLFSRNFYGPSSLEGRSSAPLRVGLNGSGATSGLALSAFVSNRRPWCQSPGTHTQFVPLTPQYGAGTGMSCNDGEPQLSSVKVNARLGKMNHSPVVVR